MDPPTLPVTNAPTLPVTNAQLLLDAPTLAVSGATAPSLGAPAFPDSRGE